MKAFVLALLLTACCEPQTTRVTVGAGDPLEVARWLVEDLSGWDRVAAPHPAIPLTIDEAGTAPGWHEVGECIRAGEYREITLHLDRIMTTVKPRAVFHHVLWHEVAHALLTCTDRDHSADPRDLMYPRTTEQNLYAGPPTSLLLPLKTPAPAVTMPECSAQSDGPSFCGG